jgi:hypothetical protein
MAKKQKDNKINNGRHNNTQTDNIIFSFCLFVSSPFYCLFFCVLLCRPLFIFSSFCVLAIILSVCLCIIVSTVVYLFDLLFLGHYIVCLSVYYCVDRCLSFSPFVYWPLYCLFVCVLLCRPFIIFLSFCFLACILSVCVLFCCSFFIFFSFFFFVCILLIHRQTDNILAKKQKDKKINNGRHNNTQTDNILAKKQKDKKIINGRHNNTQTNRQ